ncbi:MAG: pantoate--beta-alanine ligase [Halothiobacillaceae bacterium]
MKILETPESLSNFRRHVPASQVVALVPTMGNLHAGHLALVQAARARADHVVVSIFVNPTQFGPGEDFERYPRTVSEDLALLEPLADSVVLPSVEAMYPGHVQGAEHTQIRVPATLANQLCGASRPGHFDGVATIVCKLFGMVQPHLAVFGRKDYQQLVVLRRMVADLNLPVRLQAVPTVREADGLAMSSRNGYLTPDERARAPTLYATLRQARTDILQAVESGRAITAGQVESTGVARLAEAGFDPDYFAVRTVGTLAPPGADPRAWILLGAARLGNTRLIDNLPIVDEAGD